MHFTNPFPFVLVFLSITSIVASVSPPTNAMRPVGNALDGRQLPEIVEIADIIQLISGVADVIVDIIDISSKESEFTQQVIQGLIAKYPGKNTLVYHNQNSLCNFSPDAVHYHYELGLVDLVHSFTQGYEIWVFDSGTFSLSGDGGYANWAYEGCCSGPRTDLVFTKC